MKKVFYAIMFSILIALGGFLVVQDGLIRRVEKYYNEEGREAYFNNREDFLDIKMYSLGASSYLNKPIYSYQVKESDYSFDFNIYHYRYESKKEVEYAVFFEIFDFKSTNEIQEIKLAIDGVQSDQYIDSTIIPNDIKFHNNWFVHGFLEKANNETDVFRFSNSTMMINEIKKIELIDTKNNNSLLTINNTRSELSLEKSVVVNNKVTNDFNGFAIDYLKLSELYEDQTNVNQPNLEAINKYNGILNRNIIVYLVVVIVLTVFIFFRKPLQQMFENRKALKEKNKESTVKTEKKSSV